MLRVAIVGGGFSGVAVAAQLVRRATERGRAMRVVLCERRAEVGQGVAYQPGPAAHLLNVAAGNLSVWPDRPAHLVAWCERVGIAAGPDSYLPRPVYGRYLADALAEVVAAAPPAVALEVRHGAVVGARAREAGWEVALEGGAAIEIDQLVLAVGHRPPSDPLRACWRGSRERYVESAWDAAAIARVPAGAEVVVIGSGLTAIDVALSLPHARSIVAVSRRGRLPLAHGPLAPCAWPGGDATLAGLMRWFRVALRAGAEPRALVDALREHSTRVWQGWADADVDRFLRHVRGLWEVHRHRMAPEVARVIAEARRAGRLRVIAGRVREVRAGRAQPLELEVATRAGAVELGATHVINCTGPGDGARDWPAPVPALLADGWLLRDSRSLGVVTAAGGAAVGVRGVRGDLRVIGPACRPAAWESTAVPDLRVRAAELAAAVVPGGDVSG